MGQICIISDIHSNIHSLRKFLNYIEDKHNIDYILNLGDFIQDGPNPCEVFDIVMNDKKFFMIHSNYEHSDSFGCDSLTTVITKNSIENFSKKV